MATIEIIGANPYVSVSQKQAALIRADWRKPMPVLVTVNGKPDDPWHINMMPKGDGDFFLYLHGDVRKVSGTKVGDAVTIEVRFDETYQNGPQHPQPLEFTEALSKSPIMQMNWSALPPSRQKEVLRYFASLKSAEALTRNVQRAVSVLSGEPGHFMGRDWKDGR